ncbi:MAG: ATP-binding protein, partial [Thermaerobacter sp.]|nr:ATP-binding protein [Thermaerobacter sp.]
MADGKRPEYNENQIQVLEGLEAVRKRPGMYIGSTTARGLHHLVYEIIDNSIDEALAGVCDRIEVTLFKDGRVGVRDNGRGIPTGIHPKVGIPTLEVVLTMLHAGGKFGGGGYKVSGGLHGVGMSVVNALSSELEARSRFGGGLYVQHYAKGKPVDRIARVGNAADTGFELTFRPDAEIFEEVEFSFDTLATRLREQAFLNAGVYLSLLEEATGRHVRYQYQGGVVSFVEYLNMTREVVHPHPIAFSSQKDGIGIDVALQYNDSYTETMLTFANTIRTLEGGTHEAGFKAALTRVSNDFGRKLGLIKDADANLSGEDVREGLTVILSVKLPEPQFEGQTKTKLGNSEVPAATESV